jgi:hypothetical protein
MSFINILIIPLKVTNKNVTIIFYLYVILPYFLKNNSSIESFEGRAQIGATDKTENKRAKFPNYIAIDFI